ncbi:uncharacterized protein LOC144356766 [Saccoglossus kowalevskii]
MSKSFMSAWLVKKTLSSPSPSPEPVKPSVSPQGKITTITASTAQRRKRVETQSKGQKRRKAGFDESWKKTFPWLRSTSDCSGMLCSLCSKHNMIAQSGSSVWNKIPCTSMRKDSVMSHSKSDLHTRVEKLKLEAKENVPVDQVFTVQVSMHRLAIEGAMKCLNYGILCNVNKVSYILLLSSLNKI